MLHAVQQQQLIDGVDEGKMKNPILDRILGPTTVPLNTATAGEEGKQNRCFMIN
jgi:hypothetical protein